MLEGAYAAPTQQKTEGPPRKKTSEAGKVAEILGPKHCNREYSRNESLPPSS